MPRLLLLQWPRCNRVSAFRGSAQWKRLSQHIKRLLGVLSISWGADSGSLPKQWESGASQKVCPQNQPSGKGAISLQSSQIWCSEGHGRNLRPGTSPSSHMLCPCSPRPGQSWPLPTILCLSGLLLTPTKKPSCQTIVLSACICFIQLQ